MVQHFLLENSHFGSPGRRRCPASRLAPIRGHGQQRGRVCGSGGARGGAQGRRALALGLKKVVAVVFRLVVVRVLDGVGGKHVELG